MSKAEERGKTYALHKASEKLNDYYGNAMLSVVQFDGHDIQSAFTEGYHQAEKDLELTWEDIGIIISIDQQVCGAMGISDYVDNHQQAMEEVLKRFKEKK